MHRISLFLLLGLLSIVSCSEELEETPSTTVDPIAYCELKIEILQCDFISCPNPQYISEQKVSVYASRENALNDNDPISTAFTNELGQVSFTNLPCDLYYINVSNETYGNYISPERLQENSIAYHAIEYLSGYTYEDSDEWVLVTNHINLDLPQVSQYNCYRYHEGDSIYIKPGAYTSTTLIATVVEKLSETQFVVKESINSLDGFVGWFLDSDVKDYKNVWEVTEDSIRILPYSENEYCISLLWNIKGQWFPHEKEGYSFARQDVNKTEPFIDMNNAHDAIIRITSSWWGTSSCADYELDTVLYKDLVCDKISYQSFDGPIKFRVYNNNFGLIRSLNYFDGGSHTTYGFDLRLD